MTRHTLDTSWPHGCDDVAVEVSFTYQPGYAGDRIDPPCPAEVEITSVAVLDGLGGKNAASPAMLQTMQASDRLYAEMIGLAESERQSGPDAARDAAAEARI